MLWVAINIINNILLNPLACLERTKCIFQCTHIEDCHRVADWDLGLRLGMGIGMGLWTGLSSSFTPIARIS